MMVWLSARRIRRCTYLSITRMVWPCWRRVSRHCQISSRISGARPSVASSRMTRCGLVISARPSASICCSPPDSWLPMLRRRSSRRGNRWYTRSSVHGALVLLRFAANARRFSSTDKLGNICRPSGTTARPIRAILSGVSLSIRSPRNRTWPPLLRVRPSMDRTVVVLPMPLRPSKVDTWPACTCRSTPNNTWLLP